MTRDARNAWLVVLASFVVALLVALGAAVFSSYLVSLADQETVQSPTGAPR